VDLHHGLGHDQAARASGLSVKQLRRLAGFRYPKVIALPNEAGDLLFPRWQFDPAIWAIIPHLAATLDGNGWAMLAWLETPLGGLGGRTPRAALEQGEHAELLLSLAAGEE
jgi:hypothetical protein